MHTNTILIIGVFALLIIIYNLYRILSEADLSKGSKLQVTTEGVLGHVQALLDRGNYGVAHQLARKYLLKNPAHNSLRYVLAQSLYKREKYNDASVHFKILLKEMPGNREIRGFLADCYTKTYQKNLAILEYEKILHSDPDNITALRRLAEIYISQHKNKMALKFYIRLIDLMEDELEIMTYKFATAQIYYEIGEYENALADINFLLNKDPENSEYLELLKKIRIKTVRLADAINVLKILIDKNPDNYLLHEEIIELCIKNKNFESALEYCDKALSAKNVNMCKIQNLLALTYINISRVPEGIAIIENNLAENPGNKEAQITLAKAHCMSSDFDKAIFIYQQLISEAPSRELDDLKLGLSKVFMDYAAFLWDKNKFTDAFNKYLKALEYDKTSPQIYFYLGQISHKIKNYSETLNYYKMAIQLAPNNMFFRTILAQFYEEMENRAEATELYNQILEFNPKNTFALTRLGMLFLKQGDFAKAEQSVYQAIVLEPSNDELKDKLLLIYEQSGQVEKAQNFLNSKTVIIDKNPDENTTQDAEIAEEIEQISERT